MILPERKKLKFPLIDSVTRINQRVRSMAAFINFYNREPSLHNDKDDYIHSLYKWFKKMVNEAGVRLDKIPAASNPKQKEKLGKKARRLLDEASKIDAEIKRRE